MTNNINERIIKSRKSKGFTQKYLAGILNISLPTMNHYESGKRIPNSALLAKLAGVVECDPGWLLTGQGSENTQKSFLGDSSMEGFVLVPRYNIEASAGGGSIIHSEQIVDHLAFKADWVHK